MMTVTILGCGWLGKPLALSLLKKGHDVSGSSRTETTTKKIQEAGISSFTYDITTNNIPKDIVNKTNLWIISIPPFKEDGPKKYTESLANMANQFSSNSTVIYLSSTGIYPQMSGEYTEEFEFLEYEKSSAVYSAEQVLRERLKDRITILRLGGLFGPGRHPAISMQGKLDVKNPFGVLNFVHQKDAIRAIEQIIEKGITNEVFNVVHPEHPFRKEYYTKIYRQHNLKQIAFKISPTIERRISSEKIENVLKFSFNYSPFDVDDCFESN